MTTRNTTVLVVEDEALLLYSIADELRDQGFAVVEALRQHPDTARIPILVVTAKQITAADRAKLNGFVHAIMEKADFKPERLIAEVRRAMSKRRMVA